jgi:hypothetical protein
MLQCQSLHAKAAEMISSGYMDILGTATAEYWETMRTHFGIDPPPEGAPSFGLLLFGDEAEIYKDNQFMAISWSSEQSPFWSDCMKSRYLICLLPAHRYAMAGKVNLTIQEAMKQICKSVNEWQSTGVAGVHTRFVSKGRLEMAWTMFELDKEARSKSILFPLRLHKGYASSHD